MKKYLVILFASIPFLSFSQGARLQPGGQTSLVPIYDMTSVSNTFYQTIVGIATQLTNTVGVLTNLPPATNIQSSDVFLVGRTNGSYTNLYAPFSTIAASIASTIGNTANVLLLGAKGGTNDDTAILQSLLNLGGQFYFPPTNYTTGPLYVTNNTFIIGSSGSSLHLKAGVTNSAVLNWVTGISNVIVQNMTFDGGYYPANNPSAWNNSSNRMGVNVYLDSQGSVLDGVQFRGFDKGISLFGDKDTLGTPASPRVQIGRVLCITNYYGIFAKSIDDTHVVEYFTPLQLDLIGNVIGYYMGGANQGIMYGNITFNWIGIQADGANANQLHGFIMANKLNHNNFANVEVCNLTKALPDTMRIAGNEIFAGNLGILVSNACGVVIENNDFSTAPIWCGANGVSGSSLGPNWIVNNHYKGVWGAVGGADFYMLDWGAWNAGQTDRYLQTNLVHWGNWSSTQIGEHDPNITDPYATNIVYYYPTNVYMPAPLAGKTIEWYSNYDKWIITPFKTNRIYQGM